MILSARCLTSGSLVRVSAKGGQGDGLLVVRDHRLGGNDVGVVVYCGAKEVELLPA